MTNPFKLDLKTILGGIFVASAFIQSKPEVLEKLHLSLMARDIVWVITEFAVWLSVAGYIAIGRKETPAK